jgi:hypothetical protein
MTMEQIELTVLEKLRVLPLEKQREVLDFVEFLERKTVPKPSPRSVMGALAHLNIHVTEEDIAEARREMWGNFPREEPK